MTARWLGMRITFIAGQNLWGAGGWPGGSIWLTCWRLTGCCPAAQGQPHPPPGVTSPARLCQECAARADRPDRGYSGSGGPRWFWFRWRPGLLTGLFVAGYGAARFVIENFREPDAQLEDFAARTGLSMGQWLTIPMILLGLFFVARALTRPEMNRGLPAGA